MGGTGRGKVRPWCWEHAKTDPDRAHRGSQLLARQMLLSPIFAAIGKHTGAAMPIPLLPNRCVCPSQRCDAPSTESLASAGRLAGHKAGDPFVPFWTRRLGPVSRSGNNSPSPVLGKGPDRLIVPVAVDELRVDPGVDKAADEGHTGALPDAPSSMPPVGGDEEELPLADGDTDGRGFGIQWELAQIDRAPTDIGRGHQGPRAVPSSSVEEAGIGWGEEDVLFGPLHLQGAGVHAARVLVQEGEARALAGADEELEPVAPLPGHVGTLQLVRQEIGAEDTR
mmetsp:Transcript_76104/g.134366  ORF Transcript_76104/g.134366 Transcript_76104/m.134366 type:complete len:281 (+) Transcript_76104:273-1115(+)